ncbi:hypothetical protein [Acidisphaera rubrifaciens]|uniref:Oxidase Caa(3)-type subunit IV n=1 Tax=Acidisphaera rubrifaciens HS-AP3 TaxID=1231350 RepID=A0A0D6P6A4_9PROT|nr:hypothetical protein [Acidisphaera rubrifaciens]GAN76728.1 oxidase Caa(3)-type subunit IV [Acidisphaera rubrifaciens HS-AP3]
MSAPDTEPSLGGLLRHMRVAVAAFAALLVGLGAIVVLGVVAPSSASSVIMLVLLAAMVATVLLFSMEVPQEPPLTRFFSGLGFAWVAILVGMTLLDYFTR